MIARLFVAARDHFVAHLPAPMAAPETPEQRRRRWRLIGLLATMAVVTLIVPMLVLISQIGTALLWLGLALAALLDGTIWLTTKLRADAEWLDDARTREGEP